MKIKSKFLAITLAPALVIGSLGIGAAPARASEEQDWNRIIFSLSLTAITFLPTMITADGINVSSGNCGNCNSDVPFKIAFVKQAAIEAATYLGGGDMGPNLESFIKNNPDRQPDELIDAVLEIAEQL